MDERNRHLDRNLVFTDLEFTHLDPRVGEIISIACIVMDPNYQEVARGEWHMHPRWPLAALPEAMRVNRYTREAWEARGVTTHDKAMQAYLEMSRGGILVAHNVTGDWGYLCGEIKRQNMTWLGHYHKLDTLSMFWPKFVEQRGDMPGVGMWHLCNHYGISNEGAHDAMVDVERMVQLYGILMGYVDGRPERKTSP